MATNNKHGLFIMLGIAALFLTWPQAFDRMRAGWNVLNPFAFPGDTMKPGGTSAFLGIDMAIAWLVFMIRVGSDARRTGVHYKHRIRSQHGERAAGFDGMPARPPLRCAGHAHRDLSGRGAA